MPSLQSLREARAIVRWMLACFLLSIGVAVAAPLVQPPALSLVCGAGGKLLLKNANEDGATSADPAGHALDCVLCLPAGAPAATTDVLARTGAAVEARPRARPAPAHWRLSEPSSARDPPLVFQELVRP